MAKGKNIWDAVGKEEIKESAKKVINNKSKAPKQKPGRKKLDKDLIVVKAFKDSRTKLKILAAENDITMAEKLEEIVNAAFENRKR